MKAISLWNPWALLVVLGLKSYETRSWSTPYRGDLVIHAAKRALTDDERWYLSYWQKNGYVDAKLPFDLANDSALFGAALGIVTLTAIYRTEPLVPTLDASEIAFGNYGSGRYAWKLENPRLFPQPIAYRGKQGLWTWDMPLPIEVQHA